MNSRIIYIACLFITVISTSCDNARKSKEVDILGTWRLNSEEATSLNTNNALADTTAATVISFFKDGTYTQFIDSGILTTGKWQLTGDRKKLQLSDLNNHSKEVPILLGANKYGRKLFIIEDRSMGKKSTFIKEHEPLADYKNDPLYYENNTWRLKTTSPLTDSEIRKKMASYVKHMALILKAAKERNQSVVSFEFSLGPIRIYNGAIGAFSFDMVPDFWKHSFSTTDEAEKAYRMYTAAVTKADFRRASSGDWVTDDYHILSAIYAVLSKS